MVGRELCLVEFAKTGLGSVGAVLGSVWWPGAPVSQGFAAFDGPLLGLVSMRSVSFRLVVFRPAEKRAHVMGAGEGERENGEKGGGPILLVPEHFRMGIACFTGKKNWKGKEGHACFRSFLSLCAVSERGSLSKWLPGSFQKFCFYFCGVPGPTRIESKLQPGLSQQPCPCAQVS